MPSKKKHFSENEEAIFDDAVIYKRGEYWQMRMWLAKERKYARFSLKTRNKVTAIDKAKLHYHELMAMELQGKKYFSITTQMGVDLYLERRKKEVGVERGITEGRYGTIKTHLEHWLNFIKRDTKLKELERTDCEEYFLKRTKPGKTILASVTTIENEQSTINAMMKWLFKHKHTYIDGFDFPKLKRKDRGEEANRRNTFDKHEVDAIHAALADYIALAFEDITGEGNVAKILGGCYLGFSLVSGLRRGEQMQLRWCDINDTEHSVTRKSKYDLVAIQVRGITSKVRQTRKLVVKDPRYIEQMLRLRMKLDDEKFKSRVEFKEKIADELIFSVNGKNAITPRAIGYHFDRIMKNAEIADRDGRSLVPYSFRHYFITDKVNSNVPVAAIAEMCGTSITQIEKTYYHTTFDKMISNAIAGYKYVDGVLVPVESDL
ncbi:tyrosine-type recombinase/integrase [Polynucleobacter paneuropaeus]|nr:tyrosine-type recombinase/integrase [Polynucleobacter paneuropaeus]